ncbi:twin-arginine translocase TatA/TatE family subunit [Thermodesulfobacteriota bacterium]
MFGIGLPEMIIIMVIALVILGPSKLPELAKALGKGMAEFRKATQEIKESLDIDEELKEAKDDLVDSFSGLNKSLDMEEDYGSSYNDIKDKETESEELVKPEEASGEGPESSADTIEEAEKEKTRDA